MLMSILDIINNFYFYKVLVNKKIAYDITKKN